MNESNIKKLLKDLGCLGLAAESRIQREENFNIISILRKAHDERYLHSRLIAAILDPSAPHKSGMQFLEIFLRNIDSKLTFSDRGLEISPNYVNGGEKDDIDIFIRDGKNAIVIENKIYSHDSNHPDKGQLEKVYENALSNGYSPKSIEVYYLTLDGHKPSTESTDTCHQYPDLASKVKCISYGENLINWLSGCLEKTDNNTFVKKVIMQYLKIIQKLTGNSSTVEERERLAEIIGESEDNLLGAKFLIENQIHVFWTMLFSFWKELTEALITRHYQIVDNIKNETITYFIHEKSKDGFALKCKNSNMDEVIIYCKPEQPLSFSINGKEHIILINDKDLRLSQFTDDTTFRLLLKENRTEVIKEIIKTIEKNIHS